MESRKRLRIVHDTGAILAGLPLRLPAYMVSNYTTKSVVSEVLDRESRALLERMLETGILEVSEPSAEGLRKARRAADKAGVGGRLSRTDLEVLALAIDISASGGETVIATDDYSLQRAALAAGIGFQRVRYRGIGRGGRGRRARR
ncbi:MAG: nucleotide-binding protein [Desulfurococcales archaeon]|nr:nucleotide-binding protein [Desulfurococcales archaeon]